MLYIVDYIFGLNFNSIIAINPSLIKENFELWRLFLYPLGNSNIEGYLLFAAVFYFISPKMEEMVKSITYPFWLLILILSQSAFLLFAFWEKNISISGMEGISLFILCLYVFLNPKELIRIEKFGKIKNLVFASMLVSLWIGIKFFNFFSYTESQNLSFMGVFSFGFGSSFLIFVQDRIIKYFRVKRLRKSQQNMKIPKPEELSMAMMNNMKLSKIYRSLEDEEDEIYMLSNDPSENEIILNDILDKMNDKGKDSLTNLESKFLMQYAKYLEED